MRISYRIMTALVAAAYALLLISESLFHPTRVPPITPAESNVVDFDACTMWEQIPTRDRIVTLVCFGSLVVLLWQGALNRPAPRWTALLCLATLVPTVNHEFWWVQHCYTKFSAVSFWICISAIGVMCLHQIVQRPFKVP